MFKRLFDRFRVIEVEVPKGLGLNDPAGRQSLAGLAEHPGLNYLIDRVRLQRHALETRLKYGQHADLRMVLEIQLGIKWLMWVESQFLNAVAAPETVITRTATDDEYAALEQSLAAIEGVGN